MPKGRKKGGKKRATSHRSRLRRRIGIDPYTIALIALLVFSVFMEVYFFYGPSQINAADNFLYTKIARGVIDNGVSTLQYGGSVFKSEYFLIFGISAFYSLMGKSVLSFAMFGIVTFAGTVLLVYLIGKELYGRKSAMMAALLYSFYPMAVIYGANVSDTGPMAFFAALSVFLMVLAYKRASQAPRQRGRRAPSSVPLYILSGIIATIGLLVTAEGVVILVPIAGFLAAAAFYNRDFSPLKGLGYVFLGVIAGLGIIMLTSAAITGSPLHALSAISGLYTSISNTHGNLMSYLSTMMPYSLSSPITPVNYNPDNYLSGYFMYAAILAAAYLIIRKDKGSMLPVMWFLAALLYLSYGTMSLFKYNIIQFATRYAMLFGPAMALLIGRGVINFIGLPIHRRKRADYKFAAKLIISIALVALLFAQSVYLIWYLSASEYVSVQPLAQIGNYINSLPAGTSITKPYNVYLSAYVDNGYNITSVVVVNSSKVDNGTYVVAGNPTGFPQECGIGSISGLDEVFAPAAANTINPPLIPEYCNMYKLRVYIKSAK